MDLIVYDEHLQRFLLQVESLCTKYNYIYTTTTDIIMTQGLNSGKRLVQATIEINEEQYDLDFRGTDNGLTLHEDRLSRDFTINSLYMWFDFSKDEGYINYPNHGRSDVENRIIRIQNGFEHTFEDKSRYLRLIRFKVTKNARVEEELDTKVREFGPNELLNNSWGFSREVAKVFEKDGEIWIDYCQNLIDF